MHAIGRFFNPALLAILLLGAGCRSVDQGTLAHRAQNLTGDLATLGATVDRVEAKRAADCALSTAWELAHTYRAVRPGWLHNLFVNAGMRQQGLCYHWADDLAASLRRLGLRSLDIHLIVAGAGTWREHNGVAITAIGQSPLDGILLDAWRHGGQLYWARVKEDKYPWEILKGESNSVGSSP